MRLSRKKNVENGIITTVHKAPALHHTKKINKNILIKKIHRPVLNIYLNKILQKNLGPKKAKSEFPKFKANIVSKIF